MEIIIILLVAVLVSINAYIKTMANDSLPDKPVFANERMSRMESGGNRIRSFLGEEHLPVSIEDSSPDWINQKKIDWENGVDGFGNSRTDKEWLKAQGKDITRVVIEPKTVDTDAINGFAPTTKRGFEFRPTQWSEFIGQESAKERAQIIIKQFKRGMRSHLIISALRGSGKTAYIELLAKSMGAHLIQRIGRQIDEDSLIEVINEINASTNPKVVLFIDEIDTIDSKVLKVLNPIIEQFKISGKNIRPFMLASATINKHILFKNNPDFLDRIQNHLTFSRYSARELGVILYQYQNQLYPHENVNLRDIEQISLNAKFNPRTAINLLEMLIVTEDIKKVFEVSGIIKDGLTNIDIRVLKILNESKRPMGSNVISLKCGVPEADYLSEIEPFLVEFDFVNRCPSRVLTEKGKEFLRLIGYQIG